MGTLCLHTWHTGTTLGQLLSWSSMAWGSQLMLSATWHFQESLLRMAQPCNDSQKPFMVEPSETTFQCLLC